MNKIILHIPHFKLKLPKSFWADITLPRSKVENFNNSICDTKTDKLFGKNNYKKISPKFSRIFCDVEKYEDDNKEIMSKFGMGVIYTKTLNGEVFKVPSEKTKQNILKNYYSPYHSKLTKVAGKSAKGGKVILVDCHSFSSEVIMFKDKKENIPQICIGYNKNYNKILIKLINDYFIKKGYFVAHNYPYEGAMLPNGLKEGIGLACVMLEVNKEIYLNDTQNFIRIQNDINSLFKLLKNFDFNNY